jgi:hypothetical protein
MPCSAALRKKGGGSPARLSGGSDVRSYPPLCYDTRTGNTPEGPTAYRVLSTRASIALRIGSGSFGQASRMRAKSRSAGRAGAGPSRDGLGPACANPGANRAWFKSG